MSADVTTQLARGSVAFLPEEGLLEFVTAQRWFGSKSREAVGCELLDHALLRTAPPLLLLALAEIRFATGTHEVYQLLIGLRESEAKPSDSVIASVDGWTGYDALTDAAAARELIHLVRGGMTLPAQEGTVEFHTLGAIPQNGAPLVDARPLAVEQSNTSVVLDDELIVKAYRRIEAGVNPELELLAFLTQRGFANVAELHGWWTYTGPLMDATLGIVQRYVRDALHGWTLAVREVADAPEAFIGRLRRLGEVIGKMHAVLASETSDPAFAPEEPSAESLGLLTATIDEEIG